MDLSDSQKEAISGWVAEGLKLSDIQRCIKEAFNISLTYMETRFLVDDLDLELKSQPKPVEGDISKTADPEPEVAENQDEIDKFADAAPPGGKVSISLDRINRPGAVASGEVTFSDGKTAKWALDQIGRLVLNSKEDGYQPQEADVEEFQKELSVLLQNRGF